jgi:hypothetical protein
MNMKPKNPEKDLIVAMIASVIFGLMLIGFSLRSYLKSKDVPPDKVDWHNSYSVLIWGQDQLLHTLIYQAIPISGGHFYLLHLSFGIIAAKRKFLTIAIRVALNIYSAVSRMISRSGVCGLNFTKRSV